MRPSHLAVLVILSVIWGSAFMLVDVALEDVPPLTLVAGRLAVAALFLGGFLAITGRRLSRRRAYWAAFALLALVNNVFPLTLLAWGQQHIDSSLAGILTASMPLSTVVLAHFWIMERMTAGRVVGVLVGFAGVLVILGSDLRNLTESSTLAQLAIIAGMLGFTVGAVFARKYLRDEDPAVFAFGQTLVGALVMAPVALAAEAPFDLSVSAKTWLAWGALGVVASGVAYLLFFWLLQRVTATQASMVSYLIPITAVFLGALVLDERLGENSFVGLGLIIVGVWVVNGGGGWLAERVRGERKVVEV